MKIKATWEEKTLDLDGTTITYRLPSYLVYLELFDKFGKSIQDKGVLGSVEVLIEFLVWMVNGWKDLETESGKDIPYSEKDLRTILEYDTVFREALVTGMGFNEHMARLSVEIATKIEDERKNLRIYIDYIYQMQRKESDETIHAIKIDDDVIPIDSIRLLPANYEAIRILEWMNMLGMSFSGAAREYQRMMGKDFAPEQLDILRDKIQYIKSFINELERKQLKGK